MDGRYLLADCLELALHLLVLDVEQQRSLGAFSAFSEKIASKTSLEGCVEHVVEVDSVVFISVKMSIDKNWPYCSRCMRKIILAASFFSC